MKNLSSLLFILFSIFFAGCKDSGTQVQGQGNLTYPTSLNNEWEYQTTATFGFYNKSGGIDSIQNISYDNAIIKVIKANDSLKNYKGLSEFIIYNKLDPGNPSYEWYLDSDTSFVAIAYNVNIGKQLIEPKRNFSKRYLTLADVKNIIYSLSPIIRTSTMATLGDSILFYDVPRKVLDYPLYVGKNWVELNYPFYRERYVNNYLSIPSCGQQYNCYEIKVKWSEWDIELNDYVSLDAGLVKRDIIIDSIMVTNEYGDQLGFVIDSSTSTLVRKNF